MKKIKKYTVLFASFFLVLYIFIATPVSYWHSHECSSKGDSSFNFDKFKVEQLKKGSNEKVENDCSICSYQFIEYSTSNFLIIDYKIVPKELHLKQNWKPFLFETIGLKKHAGRGPPAFTKLLF